MFLSVFDFLAAITSVVKANTTATYNAAFGYEALNDNTTGQYNTALGGRALDLNTTGDANTAVGVNACGNQTTASGNTAVGQNAMLTNTASYNTAVGYAAMQSNSTGDYNVAVGSGALYVNSTGTHNTCVGRDAGASNTTGLRNTIMGASAGDNGIFNDNTFIGYASGTTAGNDANTNTCVGASAGYNISTGTNNLLLGYNAGTSNAPGGVVNNENNVVVLGNNSTTSLYCADTSISSSDSRDKTDITDFTKGLDWIKALRPVTYRWDRRTWYGTDEEPYGTPDGSKKRTQLHIGFLAQEALEIEKSNGYGSSKDDMLLVNLTPDGMSYGMKYERLVPVLVNAVKELSAENTELKARLDAAGL